MYALRRKKKWITPINFKLNQNTNHQQLYVTLYFVPTVPMYCRKQFSAVYSQYRVYKSKGVKVMMATGNPVPYKTWGKIVQFRKYDMFLFCIEIIVGQVELHNLA